MCRECTGTIIPSPPQYHLTEQRHTDPECQQFSGAIPLNKSHGMLEYLVLIQPKIAQGNDLKSLNHSLTGDANALWADWTNGLRSTVSTSPTTKGWATRSDFLLPDAYYIHFLVVSRTSNPPCEWCWWPVPWLLGEEDRSVVLYI